MFKLYQKTQYAQLRWIYEHPVQWISYNLIATAALIAYIDHKHRKFEEEINEHYENHIK